MHWEHFSKDLMSVHVWRQAQTQSTIVNFYEEDMNILNPRKNDRGNSDGIFRMEFPLMQWLVACLYKMFGNHLIITRICMFIIGLFTMIGLYKLLNTIFHNITLSLMGVWAFNFSPSFYYYTINPLPDNLALCCSVWGLALFFIWINNKRWINLLSSGVLLSIGALCKLPFILYYIVPSVYFLKLLYRNGFDSKVTFEILTVMILSILPMAWYISVIPDRKGNPVVLGMYHSQDSVKQMLDYFQHTLLSTLPELLMNYGSVLFFLAGFYYLIKRKSYKDSRFILMLALSASALMYYFFEANAIARTHDYYLFPFYPLLFILIAYGAFNCYSSGNKFKRYVTITLLLLLPITCYLRMQGRWNPDSPGFNRDMLDYKDELRGAVPKDALVIAGNDVSHFIFFYYLDKKGWGFDNDKLTSDELRTMIKNGAEYLYTDSEKIFANCEISPYLKKLIAEKGRIRIFSLKKINP